MCVHKLSGPAVVGGRPDNEAQQGRHPSSDFMSDHHPPLHGAWAHAVSLLNRAAWGFRMTAQGHFRASRDLQHDDVDDIRQDASRKILLLRHFDPRPGTSLAPDIDLPFMRSLQLFTTTDVARNPRQRIGIGVNPRFSVSMQHGGPDILGSFRQRWKTVTIGDTVTNLQNLTQITGCRRVTGKSWTNLHGSDTG